MSQHGFFLDSDDDDHWYAVPVAMRVEWRAWREIPSSDERSWEAPDFAVPIDGPSSITFPSFSKES